MSHFVKVFSISYKFVFLSNLTVKSTIDPFDTGTLTAIPVNFPSNSGMILPTALAAPVDDGIILFNIDLPPLQSLFDDPSTVFWVSHLYGYRSLTFYVVAYVQNFGWSACRA